MTITQQMVYLTDIPVEFKHHHDLTCVIKKVRLKNSCAFFTIDKILYVNAKFVFRHEKKLESSTPAPNAYNTSGLNPRGT